MVMAYLTGSLILPEALVRDIGIVISIWMNFEPLMTGGDIEAWSRVPAGPSWS